MELAGKQLVIVVGKGGVGKTTCSSAIALQLAATGKRTLLVTVDPAKRLEDSLGVPVGFSETEIQPNLSAMMLDPEAVIREHLEREVPEAEATEHPMFRYVTQYLPGLNELMAIGKLNDLRRAAKYDIIVVDTAPTGHALSFLSAPKAIEELMSERSLLKWALRGYAVWQKVQGAATGVSNLFKKKEDKETAPDIDLERIFEDIREEAQRIRAFLTDHEKAALVAVTLPERLPVEEAIDLHDVVTEKLGMKVHELIVNKVQPPLDADAVALLADKSWAGLTKKNPALAGLAKAAQFNQVRHEMNVGYVDELGTRLPDIPLRVMPLQPKDVQGLERLEAFGATLWSDASKSSNESGSQRSLG